MRPFHHPEAGSVVDLKVGPDGSLYYLTYWPGALYRVTFDTDSNLPVASAAVDVAKGIEHSTYTRMSEVLADVHGMGPLEPVLAALFALFSAVHASGGDPKAGVIAVAAAVGVASGMQHQHHSGTEAASGNRCRAWGAALASSRAQATCGRGRGTGLTTCSTRDLRDRSGAHPVGCTLR